MFQSKLYQFEFRLNLLDIYRYKKLFLSELEYFWYEFFTQGRSYIFKYLFSCGDIEVYTLAVPELNYGQWGSLESEKENQKEYRKWQWQLLIRAKREREIRQYFENFINRKIQKSKLYSHI